MRIGRVTAADAAFYNSRVLPNLPPTERSLFDGSSANKRVVTVVSNYEQAAAIQHGVQERLRDQKDERAGGCDAAAVDVFALARERGDLRCLSEGHAL